MLLECQIGTCQKCRSFELQVYSYVDGRSSTPVEEKRQHNLDADHEIAEVADREDLCKKYGPSHSMCLGTKGDHCGSDGVTEIYLTDEEKKMALDEHNKFRRDVRPYIVVCSMCRQKEITRMFDLISKWLNVFLDFLTLP